MNGIKIGTLLREERERAGITREKLSQGLCTGQRLHNIEYNECDVDKQLIDVLFSRMGMSTDKLEMIISIEQYNKIRVRDMIERLVWRDKWDKIIYLLDKVFTYSDRSVNIHDSYRYRTIAYMYEHKGEKLEEAKELILKAIELTMPEWRTKPLNEYLISVYEMENLILYARICNKLGEETEAKEHIQKCYEYVISHYEDVEERLKIYPKCALVYSRIYKEKSSDIKVIGICEDALEVLRKTATSLFMIPLMKELIFRYERFNKENEISEWKKYLEVLEDIYSEYGAYIDTEAIFFNVHQCEYHLDYEVIRGERLAKGFTQEEFIEGIYESPEPLSRVENGHIVPRKKKFDAMLEKVGLDKGRYNTFIATTSFEVLRKKDELDLYLSRYEMEEAREVLVNIEQLIDTKIPDNKRYIDNIRNTINEVSGIITQEESLEISRQLVAETYDLTIKRNRAPMRNEALIIVHYSTILSKMSKMEEALSMLEDVLERYKHSHLNNIYRMRSHLLMLANYERNLSELGQYNTSTESIRKRLREEIYLGKASLIGEGLLVMAINDIEQKKTIGQCIDNYKRAYLFDKLFYRQDNCEEIAMHYKEEFGMPIE